MCWVCSQGPGYAYCLSFSMMIVMMTMIVMSDDDCDDSDNDDDGCDNGTCVEVC